MVQIKDKALILPTKQLKVIQESWFVNTHESMLKRATSGRGRHDIDFNRDSYIIEFCGWRGAGKTTAMTVMAIMANWQYNSRLIANYPIEYILQFNDGHRRHVKAESLDFQKLLTFDDEYRNSLILIDEAPDVVSAMLAMSIKNRLVNIFVRQLRKNGNSLFLGAQQHELIDKSLRWQVDVIANCEDASRKYGNNHMRRGACILLSLFDNSGMWTGKHWQEISNYRGKDNCAASLKVTPSILWGDDNIESVYDTFYQQDILESLRKATLRLDAYEVTDHRADPADSQYILKAAGVIQELMGRENSDCWSKDFFAAAGPLTNKEKDALTKRLHACDVRRGQSGNGKHYYSFENFNIDRFMAGVNGSN